jgi:glyoxylase-like metal-dependent hydrolase (beta-lactamase superfamily II)
MRYSNFSKIGPVDCYELGQSPIKSLLFTVFFFKIDGILIDSSAMRCRNMLPDFGRNGAPHKLYLTHHHEDHSGNASFFQKKYQLSVYGHPKCAEKLKNSFDILPYESILFGKPEPVVVNEVPETFETSNYRFETIHTPGHCDDHVCYYVPSEGWLFSGDLYVADKIKIWRKGESVAQQIQSLEKLLQLDFDVLFCAHNPQAKGGKQKLLQKQEHLIEFYEAVKLCISKGYTPRQTMSALNLKEKYHVKWITFNDVSVIQKVMSVYKEIV